MKRLMMLIIAVVFAVTACGSDGGTSETANDATSENTVSEDVSSTDSDIEASDEEEVIEEAVDQALETDEPLAAESSTPDGICAYVNLETVESILPGAAGTPWEVMGEPWCDFYGSDGIDGAYLSINEFAADNSEFRLNGQAEELVIDGTPLTIHVEDSGKYEIGATIPTNDGMYGGFMLIFGGSDASDEEIRPVLETLASELLSNRS